MKSIFMGKLMGEHSSLAFSTVNMTHSREGKYHGWLIARNSDYRLLVNLNVKGFVHCVLYYENILTCRMFCLYEHLEKKPRAERCDVVTHIHCQV